MATTKDKQIAAAQKLVEKGQFDKAIKAYLQVVGSDDKDVRIWLKIGDLYAKIGKKAEAAETYQRVAEFYSEQGFYLKSVAVYKQILKIDPRLVDVNQRLAELYKQLGLLSDAMQQYEAVAAFYHKEGKTREALAALKQIVELDPETVANRIKLAELYSKEQMPREAIDEFTRAADQLKESGRTDDYLKVAERLLFHSPDNRVVSKELARLYIEKGDPRRALPKLQVCFKADSRDTDVLMLLSRAFEALDQRAKAVSVLKELARILTENGDRPARDQVYRKILALQPGDADAESALGTGPGPGAGAHAGPARTGRTGPAPAHPGTPLDRPPSGPGVLGASWPPPPVLREESEAEREFDEPPARTTAPARSEAPAAAPNLAQTSVGRLLDASSVEPTRAADGGEEVARILNETDVYIKYKLYAKAIEHVQRVFEHDPQHTEAREKLKALYLTVGKREEAVLELWALAEHAEPGRQRRYLREILELEPTHAQAAALLGESPSARAQAAGGSDEQALDVDELEELNDSEFEVADPSGRIDLSEELGTVSEKRPILAHGSSYEEELPVEEAESAEATGDDDLIPLVVDPIADAGSDPSAPGEIEDRFGFDDSESTAEPEVPEAIGPTDSEEHAVSAGARAVASEDNDVRTRFDDQAAKLLQHDALFGPSDSSDASELSDEVDERDLPSVANLQHGTATIPSAALPRSLQETPPPGRVEPASIATKTALDPPNEGSLEDDLDEADFFIQQSLFD
ncbi:MAG: tetratricopeptide repeat protein, partial [Polyangia bacterium]